MGRMARGRIRALKVQIGNTKKRLRERQVKLIAAAKETHALHRRNVYADMIYQVFGHSVTFYPANRPSREYRTQRIGKLKFILFGKVTLVVDGGIIRAPNRQEAKKFRIIKSEIVT